jgi:hypothetical protein
LSRKSAKSRRRITVLRSKTTKSRTRVSRIRKPQADLKQKLEGCRCELAEAREHLAEALEQQAATSKVLSVISSSSGELEPVFSAMLENALRICEAKFGMLLRYSDGAFVAQAMVGAPPALVDALLRKPFTPPPGVPLDRMFRTKKVVPPSTRPRKRTSLFQPDLGARVHISLCRCSKMTS